MTIAQLERRLQTVGASTSEASDLAPILHIDGWFEVPSRKVTRSMLVDLETRLAGWRIDRRELAAIIRKDRQSRIDAGYPSRPVSDGVWLNGATLW